MFIERNMFNILRHSISYTCLIAINDNLQRRFNHGTVMMKLFDYFVPYYNFIIISLKLTCSNSLTLSLTQFISLSLYSLYFLVHLLFVFCSLSHTLHVLKDICYNKSFPYTQKVCNRRFPLSNTAKT